MDSSHHRKIELQSPEDLRYLIDNVSRRAREKIDLNLPPSAAPEGEDALRRRVEELVHEFEPYDRRLHTRVQTLQASIESSTLALSQLRRDAPAAAADAYIRQSAERAAAAAAAVAELNAAATVVEGRMPLDLKPLERQEEVERAYGRSLEVLGGLKSGLPATAAKLERARKAAEHVEKTR
ncbi:hypothetical protein FGG08_001746 [Glutinoglossum americanum]|uniref:Uncharacterized protein n=1 Tax=Glutinoglossum americanum TaxID=1670608 RepID=A0A9P8KZW6_9PEZI|nr:hypothetical protein FGG08_001746 [Glutinoglossum americanum]